MEEISTDMSDVERKEEVARLIVWAFAGKKQKMFQEVDNTRLKKHKR